MNPRPPYSLLRQHYPDPINVSAEELWRWVGHPGKNLDPAWKNTCAIRVSLALLGAGVPLPRAFLPVLAGKYKGLTIEIKQEVLAHRLTQAWGEPDRFATALIRDAIRDRSGIIRFVQLWGPYDPQGHIDLIAPERMGRLMCEGGHVYWHAVECWFWELP